MKKTVRILALVLMLAMLCMTFASCSMISGTYAAGTDNTYVSYAFKGNKVTVRSVALGIEVTNATYKYSIKDNSITFTVESTEKDDKGEAKKYEGTFDFEKGDGYVKIGAVKYTERK